MGLLLKSCVVFLLPLLFFTTARVQTPSANGRTDNGTDSIEGTVISNIDLSRPFATREAWRFVATQGPPVYGLYDEKEPGQIQLCLRMAPSTPCGPELNTEDIPHYLNAVKIVYPRGPADKPLLLVQTAGLHGGNGSQLESTQMLAYESSQNRFVRVYQYAAGRRNNNGEVRYISSGRLKGEIISAVPTENAPYAYWVTVNALTPQYTYTAVLRYRSATHYGDHNPLSVIDSEMPNIEQRLGYWKPGMALPLPPGGCPIPRLIRMELWCN
jgi:hypothetical protein